MKIAVILNAHENSLVFKDTLESVIHYMTDDVLVVVDGFGWEQFEKEKIPARTLCGLNQGRSHIHGSNNSPYRNMALGLMKSWEVWGKSVDWYCYLEYDCLIGSSKIKDHLAEASKNNVWLIGNDLREDDRQIKLINNLIKKDIKLKYLLGCCLFFNSEFISRLSKDNFFTNLLNFSNLHGNSPFFFIKNNKIDEKVYDISEFLYPTLANSYGKNVGEFACWNHDFNCWRGVFQEYPMRFVPDLTLSDPVLNACIMHPIKDFDNPVRHYHRGKRKLPFK